MSEEKWTALVIWRRRMRDHPSTKPEILWPNGAEDEGIEWASSELERRAKRIAELEGQLCRARKWRVTLTCCGRSDGEIAANTWEEADKIRNEYTSGMAVNPHGYPAHETESGHRRSAVIETAPCPHESRVRELEKAVEWACGLGAARMLDEKPTEDFQSELRRRAAGEGG